MQNAKNNPTKSKIKTGEREKPWGHINSLAVAKREIILILSAYTKYRLQNAFDLSLSLSHCLSISLTLSFCLQKSMPDIVDIIRYLNVKDTLSIMFAHLPCECVVYRCWIKMIKKITTTTAQQQQQNYARLRLNIEIWSQRIDFFCTWWLAIVTRLMIIPLSVGTK